jgi:hypothetical protein
MLYLSCFEPGQAKLKIQPDQFGWQADDRIAVKNVLNGKPVFNGPAAQLAQGIPISVQFENEPCILGVGLPKELDQSTPLFPGENFADLNMLRLIENPETLIDVPDAPGVKTAIYHRGKTTLQLLEALKKAEGVNAFILPRIDEGALSKCEVLIIPEPSSDVFIGKSAEIIKNWVEKGGGLMLIHSACAVKGVPLLPVYKKADKMRFRLEQGNTELIINPGQNPLARRPDAPQKFVPGFQFDYFYFEPGKDQNSIIAVKDPQDRAVVLLSKFGRGKVMLDGKWTGYQGKQGEPGGSMAPPEGTEKEILLDGIKWLGSK